MFRGFPDLGRQMVSAPRGIDRYYPGFGLGIRRTARLISCHSIGARGNGLLARRRANARSALSFYQDTGLRSGISAFAGMDHVSPGGAGVQGNQCICPGRDWNYQRYDATLWSCGVLGHRILLLCACIPANAFSYSWFDCRRGRIVASGYLHSSCHRPTGRVPASIRPLEPDKPCLVRAKSRRHVILRLASFCRAGFRFEVFR